EAQRAGTAATCDSSGQQVRESKGRLGSRRPEYVLNKSESVLFGQDPIGGTIDPDHAPFCIQQDDAIGQSIESALDRILLSHHVTQPHRKSRGTAEMVRQLGEAYEVLVSRLSNLRRSHDGYSKCTGSGAQRGLADAMQDALGPQDVGVEWAPFQRRCGDHS